MCGMILRLDPTREIVWRSPFSLQIGVDPVAAILENVDHGDERLIATLTTGATREALDHTAVAAQVTPERVNELLRHLGPALLADPHTPPTARGSRVSVRGAVSGRARIARVLAEAGSTVVDSPATGTRGMPRPDVAVLVSHHVPDPLEHLAWLRRDTAHLPVVFGERAVTIGPMVRPGISPCLACLEQQRADADPAWTAIGSQLWGREAAMDTALAAALAALEVLTMVQELSWDRGEVGASIRLDPADDSRTVRRWAASDRCGCRGLELTASASDSP
jgi:hypothetical protein